MKTILPIVEGGGDERAVPALIRRIAQSHGKLVQVLKPHRRGDLPKVRKRFSDYLLTAKFENAPILWVMDYDCADCKDVNADIQQLRQLAENAAPGLVVRFAFMVKEYESLFLADERSTRKVLKEIPAAYKFPSNPEGIRGAKEVLSKALPKGLAYKETIHQEKITAHLDCDHLRQVSPSFQRFEAALLDLLSD